MSHCTQYCITRQDSLRPGPTPQSGSLLQPQCVCGERMRALQSNATRRHASLGTDHSVSPHATHNSTCALCVRALCVREGRKACCLFPQCAQFVRKFQASACTVAQRRQAHVGACRAHSLGPRNRLPSSTTHTRAVLLGPPPSVKRRRSQPPSSRMLGTATVLRGLWQVAVTGSRCGTPFCSRKQASKPRRPACCRQHT